MPPRGAPQMMMPGGVPGGMPMVYAAYPGQMAPGMMRPGMPHQGFVAVAQRPFAAYPQGGYVQMGAAAPGMMMAAGMQGQRPMGQGMYTGPPPAQQNMYAPPPGAPQQPGGGMRPIPPQGAVDQVAERR